MNTSSATGDWTPAPDGATDRPTIPGYDLLDELGRGGMGVVYRARHVPTGRLVALKVIRDAALAGPTARARFRVEAEAAARVRHPNVVEVYEVGEHAGRPFLAMELVAGGGLDRHLGGTPLPAREAAELVRLVALAVQAAHDRNIVHRDLKPANILLSPVIKSSSLQVIKSAEEKLARLDDLRLGDLMTPKVSDFGLAKRLDADTTAWTQDGAVLGTPGYMAPEQAAGRVHEVGPGADVWALGAVLYECLTGRPPFRADTRDETVRQVLHDDPEPPGRVEPGAPADLETVCLKCLEKEPARRYGSAQALADDLGRFLAGVPVIAVPPTPVERLGRSAIRDGYRLVGEVGRGPGAAVYRAESVSTRQPVAVKVFPPGTGTREEWEARLRRLPAVAHPQVVPVVRAGWWDGSPVVVSEFAPLGSLAARLGGRPRPVREAVGLVVQLAEVVGYLHRQGVVHANLKPANVLFAAGDTPRLADFRPTGGLFQGALPAAEGDPAGLGDLPPEYLRDPAAEARPHTDVYGLGLILYELLTGRPAFAGATAGEVSGRVRAAEPVPPSRLNPEVPPGLDAVCLKCLRKDPWRRYTRVYDLAARLREVVGDRPARGWWTGRPGG
ncbi:MAG: serine/threonine protein kinase [Gemmataceae bacterium]|nr:serine/threonine protein kinase [Gemmataceae bacterium]